MIYINLERREWGSPKSANSKYDFIRALGEPPKFEITCRGTHLGLFLGTADRAIEESVCRTGEGSRECRISYSVRRLIKLEQPHTTVHTVGYGF